MVRTRARLALLAVAVAATAWGSTAQAEPPPVRFTAAGDFGASSQAQAVLSSMGATPADLHLALGDLSYGVTGQEQAWCDLVTARVGAGEPFELLSGNHESGGQNGNINDFSACLPNQLPGLVGTYGREYRVDVPQDDPQVRYIGISPGLPYPGGTWSYAAGTARHAWTAAAIDGARAAGIPWVVVGMHKPCLSMGVYACDPGQDLLRLLVDRRVDLVLHGHEHMYQRTKQLAHSAGCPGLTPGAYVPACVVDGDSDLVAGAGTVFATVGTGGIPLREVATADPEAGYFAAWSGLGADPTFGHLDVQVDGAALSARFVRAAGGSFSDAFVIRRGPAPPNTPPVAVVAPPACTGATCAFDGSGSSDPDGTVVRWAWDLGDGTTALGPRPSHGYSASGTYAVGLVVTDDRGATATAGTSVTVTVPPGPSVVAQDGFTRTVTGGWGTADTGGAWTVTSPAASTVDGTGRLRLPSAGSGPSAFLTGVSSSSTDLRLRVALDKVPTGGGAYVSVLGRRLVPAGDYRLKLRALADGTVTAALVRLVGSTETSLVQGTVPGLRLTAGQAFLVRLQVTGASPTSLRAKVWRAGDAEPAAWLLQAGDSTASLQGPGGLGVVPYLSSTATNAPLVLSVDDLVATAVP